MPSSPRTAYIILKDKKVVRVFYSSEEAKTAILTLRAPAGSTCIYPVRLS